MKTRARRQCDVASCDEFSTVYLYMFENRVLIGEKHFCKRHLNEEIPNPVSRHAPDTLTNLVPLELHLLFCALDAPSFVICFCEVNGVCRFNIRVDSRRAALLKGMIENGAANNTMYKVLEATIKRFGQHPTKVVIDRLSDRYSATLHLRESSCPISIPLATDAILFALTAELPIYATPSSIIANCVD